MIGIVTIQQLSQFRKFAILGIVIVAAAITPSPDVISQIALAVPLYMLYEGSIIVCRILRARKTKKESKS
jgi:sec-independent protein translocase protein TatC